MSTLPDPVADSVADPVAPFAAHPFPCYVGSSISVDDVKARVDAVEDATLKMTFGALLVYFDLCDTTLVLPSVTNYRL